MYGYMCPILVEMQTHISEKETKRGALTCITESKGTSAVIRLHLHEFHVSNSSYATAVRCWSYWADIGICVICPLVTVISKWRVVSVIKNGTGSIYFFIIIIIVICFLLLKVFCSAFVFCLWNKNSYTIRNSPIYKKIYCLSLQGTASCTISQMNLGLLAAWSMLPFL